MKELLDGAGSRNSGLHDQRVFFSLCSHLAPLSSPCTMSLLFLGTLSSPGPTMKAPWTPYQNSALQ